MRVKVLCFGVLKDITGFSEESLEVPEGSTLATVLDLYATRYARLAEMRRSVLLARNQRFESLTAALADGDELALLPPVSGGASPYAQSIQDDAGHFFALTREPIAVEPLKRAVLRGEDGALAIFEGVTRNNTRGRRTIYLDYECYEAMAILALADLGRAIAAAHAISRIAVVHRFGRLEVGETSVAIVVSASHRGPAFDACREMIDRLKRVVPIWKKEYFEDGEVWVEGEWDPSLVNR